MTLAQHEGRAVALWDRAFSTGRLEARVRSRLRLGGERNGYIIFDAADGDNFKYAGMDEDADEWVIGECVAGSCQVLASAAQPILLGVWYDLEVLVSGDTVTLKANSVARVSHTFEDGIQSGQLGLGLEDAHTQFDDVGASSYELDDFRDGDAAGWTASGGEWLVEQGLYAAYSGQAEDAQLSIWDASMTEGTLAARVRTQRWTGHRYNGYLVFDYRDEENFKYAGMWEGANRWVIREVAGGESTTCATTEEPIHRLVLYELEVVVEGDSATLMVDGEEKVSCDFGPGGIHGGQVGLRIANAHTHFKEVELRQFTRVRKYYYFHGQRVAMREDGAVRYIAGDHLGTTSAVMDANGDLMFESRHLPYGDVRWTGSAVSIPTDYRFTGERLHEPLGSVYHMGARFYDSALGRWLSADTLVPDPSDPQSLNRYSWVLNHPLRYRDPSGRFSEDQLRNWYGEDWESLFGEDWAALLLEAEFGDMVLYGYSAMGDPMLAMFGLDRTSRKLDIWNVFPGGGQSGRITPLGQIVREADRSQLALYRSGVANREGGPSDSPESTWLYDSGFRRHQRVGGSYAAPDVINLPPDWYRGTREHVWAVGYPAGFDLGFSDALELFLAGGSAALARWAGATTGNAIVQGLGGAGGVVALAVSVYDWLEWDTGFWIDARGPGLPPPQRPPEP